MRMKDSNQVKRFLLLDLKHRNYGSMLDANGKSITWEDADLVVVLEFEGNNIKQIRKYVLAKNASKSIQDKLLDVHWGAVIDLIIENHQVIDVDIVLDSMSDLYSYE